MQASKEITKIEMLDEDTYSPYMLRYRGSGMFGKYNYCAMNYLEPKKYVTLKDYFEDDFSDRMNLYKRYNIIKQIVSGLRYAHEHNIYHGDLHTNNIMIEKSSGLVKIVDFGTSFRDKSYSRNRDNRLMMKTSTYVLGDFYNADILMNIDYANLPSNAIRLIVKAMSKIIVLNSFWEYRHNEELVKSISFFCALVPFFNLGKIVDMLFYENKSSDNKYKKIFLDTLIEYMTKCRIIVHDDKNRGEISEKYMDLQKRFIEICNTSCYEADIYNCCTWDEIKRFNENLYSENVTERDNIERILE